MAIVGGGVILQWSVGLCRQSAQRLLDVSASEKVLARIRASIDALGGARVNDLHVWPIGADSLGCLVSIESRVARPLVDYRSAVRAVAKVSHLTIEVDHLGEESIASFGDA
jgi:Co/Zn/Cd efflux system component